MASRAGCGNPRMAHGPGRKRRRAFVAIFTGRRRREMACWLGHHTGICPAMTACTSRCDPRMAHRRARSKGRRRGMARLTPRRGRKMVRRFRHDAGIGAAMTRGAPVHNPRVTHRPDSKR